MSSTSILVRDVPEHIKRWVGDSRPTGISQQEFLLGILESAYTDDAQPILFAPRSPTENELPPTIRFRFIDLFAGIGGFRIGMTAVGGKCVFTSEWDKFAQKTYRAWFGEDDIWGDINSPDLDIKSDIPDHDVLCAGFPCQPFSLAGVSKKNSLGVAHGFDCVKQGNLFFRICDIIDVKRPPILLLENVKNLRSHDKKRTWAVIESALKDRNYVVHQQIIDAQHWVPQHRERIFIVCFDRNVFGDNPPFEYPNPPDDVQHKLGDILEARPDPKYTLTDHLWTYLQNYAEKHRKKGNGFGFGLVGKEDITRTLSARYYKDGSEVLIRQSGKKNPRRLTHREAARLMGYDEEYAHMFGHPDRFPMVVSDTQGYKQFGNSVVPKVVEAVGRQIVKVMAWQHDRSGNGCVLKGRIKPKRLRKMV